jgi:hypothetical protein
LMAARTPESDSSVIVLAELERLGTGVDRLTSLYEMARNEQPATPAEEVDGAEIAAATATETPAPAAVETAAAATTDAEPAAAAPGALADATDSDVAQAIAAMTLDDGVPSGEETAAEAATDAGTQTAAEGDTGVAEAVEAVAEAPVAPPRAGRGKRKSRARERAEQADVVVDAKAAPEAVRTASEEIPADTVVEAIAAETEPALAPAEIVASDESAAAAEGPITSAEIDIVALPDEETGEAHLVGVHETSDELPAVDRGGGESDDETDPNGETFLAAPELDGGGDPEGGTHT